MWYLIVSLPDLCTLTSCADPGMFVRGGPGQSDKKKAQTTFLFYFFFLVLSLFYRRQMVNFKEIYHFSRFQRGSNIFQGVQLFPGGSNYLFPIETNITCDFPGGVRTPFLPPLDPHLCLLCQGRFSITKIQQIIKPTETNDFFPWLWDDFYFV